jgi:hypothetical protein
VHESELVTVDIEVGEEVLLDDPVELWETLLQVVVKKPFERVPCPRSMVLLDGNSAMLACYR